MSPVKNLINHIRKLLKKYCEKKEKKITKSQNVAVNQENADSIIAGKNQELSKSLQPAENSFCTS